MKWIERRVVAEQFTLRGTTMKVAVVLVVVFSCSLAFSQAITDHHLPEAPSVVADTETLAPASTALPAIDHYVGTSGSAQPIIKVATPTVKPRPEPKVVDKKFVALLALAAGAAVADVELTSRCLRAQTCTEANPIYGRNPSRGRMYAISIPILGGQMGLSAWLKHRHPFRKTWMFPMIGGTAAHGIGAATTLGK